MKTRLLLSAALLVASSLVGRAQTTTPPSADAVLNEAYTTAAKENKKVMVLFHASWCGWCKKMEASLNDPAVKKSFDDNYVIRWLVVEESKGKENLENSGAMALLTKYHGEKLGIPFFLIMDTKGTLLADSQIRPTGASLDTPGENMGCPASDKEVANFSTILKLTSHITEPQLAAIRERFSKNAPAPTAAAPKASR